MLSIKISYRDSPLQEECKFVIQRDTEGSSRTVAEHRDPIHTVTFEEFETCTFVWNSYLNDFAAKKITGDLAITDESFTALAKRELKPIELINRASTIYNEKSSEFSFHPIPFARLLESRLMMQKLDVETGPLEKRIRKFEAGRRLTRMCNDEIKADSTFGMSCTELLEAIYNATKKKMDEAFNGIFENKNDPIATEDQIHQLADQLLGILKRIERKFPGLRFVTGEYSLQRLLAYVIEKTGNQLEAQQWMLQQIQDDSICRKLLIGYRFAGSKFAGDSFTMPLATAIRMLAPQGSETLRQYLFTLLDTGDPYIFAGLCFSPKRATVQKIAKREYKLNKTAGRTLQVSDYFNNNQKYSLLAEILNRLNDSDILQTFRKLFEVFERFMPDADKAGSFLSLFTSLSVQQPAVKMPQDKRNWLERLFNKKLDPGIVYPSTMLATFFRTVPATEIGPLLVSWFSLCVSKIVNGFFPSDKDFDQQDTPSRDKDPFAVMVIQKKLNLLSYPEKVNILNQIMDKLAAFNAEYEKTAQYEHAEKIKILLEKVREMRQNAGLEDMWPKIWNTILVSIRWRNNIEPINLETVNTDTMTTPFCLMAQKCMSPVIKQELNAIEHMQRSTRRDLKNLSKDDIAERQSIIDENRHLFLYAGSLTPIVSLEEHLKLKRKTLGETKTLPSLGIHLTAESLRAQSLHAEFLCAESLKSKREKGSIVNPRKFAPPSRSKTDNTKESPFSDIDVSGDGGCLFHAIALGLQLNENAKLSSRDLRNVAASHLKHNRELHTENIKAQITSLFNQNREIPHDDPRKNQFPGIPHAFKTKLINAVEAGLEAEQSYANSEKGVNDYINHMFDPTAWGGEIELGVLAELLQLQFLIYDGKEALEPRHPFIGPSEAPKVHLLFDGDHYGLRIPKASLNCDNLPQTARNKLDASKEADHVFSRTDYTPSRQTK